VEQRAHVPHIQYATVTIDEWWLLKLKQRKRKNFLENSEHIRHT
jgi:hypothetical protein